MNELFTIEEMVIGLVMDYKVKVSTKSIKDSSIITELTEAINRGFVKPRDNKNGSVKLINGVYTFVENKSKLVDLYVDTDTLDLLVRTGLPVMPTYDEPKLLDSDYMKEFAFYYEMVAGVKPSNEILSFVARYNGFDVDKLSREIRAFGLNRNDEIIKGRTEYTEIYKAIKSFNINKLIKFSNQPMKENKYYYLFLANYIKVA